MRIRRLSLLCAALLLGACGGTSSSSSASSSSAASSSSSNSSSSVSTSESVSSSVSSSSSESSSLSSSSSESVSSSSSSQSVSSSESEVSSSSSYRPVPGDGAWTLLSSALPQNPAQGKLQNVEFSTTDGAGRTISFIGYDILNGAGTKGLEKISIDNTIQVSKETGYFYMTAGSAWDLEFKIAHVTGKDGTGTFDVTGTPTIYADADIGPTGGTPVELERKESEDGHYYIYSCMLPAGRFRLANESNYVINIYYLQNRC